MARYKMDELRIDGACCPDKVLEFTMDIGVNRHGVVTYGGYIAEDVARQYVQQRLDNHVVNIYLKDELEFCGIVQKIRTEQRSDYWYLKVELVTSTQLTDIDKHNRFFQDTDSRYSEVIAEAYDDSGVGNLLSTSRDMAIALPILQYRETDWQFTLRMAGNLNTIVIPNVTSDAPQVLLGVPQRRPISELNETKYKANSKSWHLSYDMQSDNRYRLGDTVLIQDRDFIVVEKKFAYTQGELQESYVFGREPEFAMSYHCNKRIAGLELEGTVISRDGHALTLVLDIDKERNNVSKTWFNYSPAANNGMYSMPLEDEKVVLKWQSASGHDVLAIRPSRQNSSNMPHHTERHFLDENDNHLQMLPDMMEYKNPVGNISAFLDIGFVLSTMKNVSLYADDDVKLSSKDQIRIYSPERIVTCKTDVRSSLDMRGDEIHIRATEKVNMPSKANTYGKEKLPNKPEGFSINLAVASKIAASVPKVLDARKYRQEDRKCEKE